ncbi:MAG TPA: hypothetical protein VH621_06690, partial [Nitrososphaera sp.]
LHMTFKLGHAPLHIAGEDPWPKLMQRNSKFLGYVPPMVMVEVEILPTTKSKFSVGCGGYTTIIPALMPLSFFRIVTYGIGVLYHELI